MTDARELLRETAELAADFLDSLDRRPVFPSAGVEELRARLGGALPDRPSDPRQVVTELAEAAEAGIVGSAGGRYFGFVIGGSLPAALGAEWLTVAWDQPAGLYGASPAASVVEEVAGAWLAELLGLPRDVSFAFVTGCQMAHVTALAAARHHVLREAGWDVERDGLTGAPPIRVLAGANATSRSTVRCACSGSEALRWSRFRPTTRAGCSWSRSESSSRRRESRRSSAHRPAR